tara:strand:+ start:169 stop:423 length:255 start_codon:yes stop_codon:yes gene_type:complete
MPSTKYLNKYLVEISRPEFSLKKKYKSVKEILDDLKDTDYPISGRNAVYQIINGNICYKYRDFKITKIREPLKIKRRVIIEVIE